MKCPLFPAMINLVGYFCAMSAHAADGKLSPQGRLEMLTFDRFIAEHFRTCKDCEQEHERLSKLAVEIVNEERRPAHVV